MKEQEIEEEETNPQSVWPLKKVVSYSWEMKQKYGIKIPDL